MADVGEGEGGTTCVDPKSRKVLLQREKILTRLPLTFDPTAGSALLTVKWSLLSSVKISQDLSLVTQ